MKSPKSWRRVALAALIPLILSACNSDGQSSVAAPAPSEVGVVTVAPTEVAVTTSLPGRLEASRVAQVRARAAGIVLKREFREGADVQAGELLYRIDPAPLRAALSSAEAQLSRARANLKLASVRAERYAPLVETNAISKQEYDEALAGRDQAAAEVEAAKAAVETARLNLSYATVTAPIDGRIGRALVTEGALVGQGEVTPLANIQQLDPIYVNLTQSSADLLRLQRELRSGRLQSVGEDGARVTLVTEDGVEHPHVGRLLFSDVSVDASTGAVTLRAEVPNPDRSLLPGMYVRARLEQGVASEALTVPRQAVSHSGQGASVLVVDAEGKAAVRPVKTGGVHGGNWIIEVGLQPGEQVIVDGLQKVRPGAPVRAVDWQNPLLERGAAVAGTPASSAAQAN